jgi:hypothetical protein
MTKLQDFTLEEMMIFTVSVLAGFSACVTIILKTLFRSKCKTINLCCLKCERDVEAVIEEEKLELGKFPTPRRRSLAEENKEVKKEVKLELKEPEAEDESLF